MFISIRCICMLYMHGFVHNIYIYLYVHMPVYIYAYAFASCPYLRVYVLVHMYVYCVCAFVHTLGIRTSSNRCEDADPTLA